MDYKAKQNLVKDYQDLYSDDLQKLKDNYTSIFPNGKINARVYSGIGNPTLSVSFLLIGNNEDQSNGIVDNDPIITKFIAHLPCIESPSKETKFKVERLVGDLSIRPPEGSYLAMGRVRLPYRKSTGDIGKQIQNLTKYFKKVGQTVIDNKYNLYNKNINQKYLDINF